MLMERTVELDAAKSLAKVGTWTFNVPSGKIVWSEEMYQILGYGAQRFPVVLEQSLDRIHGEDRELFREELRAARRTTDPLHHEFRELKLRVDLPDGERRTILAKLQVSGIEDGRPTRLAGTIQDITERERIAVELERLRRTQEPTERGRSDLPIWMIPWSNLDRGDTRRHPRKQV